jgi:molybdopterin-guanine dinucleotide biosynthesis protein A
MYCGVPEEDPDKLVALILSGGQSSRMGTDKGSMELNGERLVERAGNLCASAGLPFYYSINASQNQQYLNFLPADALIVDTLDDIKGPLAGLLSFYVKYPNTDVLLLPCDMIHLGKSILSDLVQAYETMSIGHDIIVYQYANEIIEPMPGIYTSEALRKIYWLFLSGDLTRFSLKYCIEISNSFFIPIKKEAEVLFKNVNSPEDITPSK